MKCSVCGSERVQVVSNVTGKIKNGRGCGWMIFHCLLTILTAGIWLIFLLIRGSATKGKIETDTKFICLDCGAEVKQRYYNHNNSKGVEVNHEKTIRHLGIFILLLVCFIFIGIVNSVLGF